MRRARCDYLETHPHRHVGPFITYQVDDDKGRWTFLAFPMFGSVWNLRWFIGDPQPIYGVAASHTPTTYPWMLNLYAGRILVSIFRTERPERRVTTF